MAQTQVTHDGVSKEEKEQLIHDYLISHGLYIMDAPKVQHQEANIIQDDIRYPLRGSIETKTDSSEEKNYDYSELTHIFDNSEELPRYVVDPLYTKIAHNTELSSLLDDTTYPYTGLCLRAEKKESFTFTVLRPVDGVVDIDVYADRLYSFLVYNGSTFSQINGKVMGFNIKSCRKGIDVRIFIDQSQPFNSKKLVISSNNLVDIDEYDSVFDISVYGTDIKKIYTDWVEDFEKNGTKKEPVVYVPSGNIKETLPIPPVQFDGIYNPDMRKIKAVLSELYSVQLLDDSKLDLHPNTEYEMYYWFIGANTFTGIIKDCVFYNVPTRYIKSIYEK